MRKILPSSLGQLVESTKELLTHRPEEQIIKDKETVASSLQSKSATPQEKADHPAPPAVENSKKIRIPFVALALVLLFTSFCTLSLVQIRPVDALSSSLARQSLTPASTVQPSVSPTSQMPVCYDTNKTKVTCLDGTSLDCSNFTSSGACQGQNCYQGNESVSCPVISPDCSYWKNSSSSMGSCTPTVPTGQAESVPQDQSISYLLSQGNAILGPGLGYDPKNCSHPYHTATGDAFCWNENDFAWADRDVTCLYNDMHGAGQPWDVNMSDKNGKKLSIHLDSYTDKLNQNTCTDNSVCVSDNASYKDTPEDPNSQIHAQIGGDGILCGNQGCISEKTGNTNECGGTSGKQLAYDRFACAMTSDTSSMLEDKNWKSPGAFQSKALFTESRQWWSKGVAINPTAYDPNGALYLPTTNLRAADIEPSKDSPECDASGHWSCPNNATIIVYQYNGSVAKVKDKYEEVVPHYTSTQFQEQKGAGGKIGQSKAWTPGSAYVPVYWVVCGAQSGWAFPCSDLTSSGMPVIVPENKSQSLNSNPVNEAVIVKDWLSGNADPKADNSHITLDPKTSEPIAPQPPSPGHLVYTYLNDTIYQPGIQKLFPYSLAFGFLLIGPVIAMIGYQFLWASWTFGRAGAMEALGRMILSVSAIVASYQLAAMLISLANMLNMAIVAFHIKVGYPPITINNEDYLFTLQGQGENDPASFRGIVVPITRWGCVGNDFVALLANKFWTDAAGYVPFVGGIAKFIGNVFNAIDAAKHIGEFAMLLLSISLCTQVFMRVLLLNYYILTGPLAFGCWGLPGGVGQQVVRSWAKGFVSLLFAQTAQIFVLATFPLILPPFPYFPTDRFGILNVVVEAIPRILVLTATIKVPAMMGTGATKAVAQAGTVVSGAVAAAGAMAMNAV